MKVNIVSLSVFALLVAAPAMCFVPRHSLSVQTKHDGFVAQRDRLGSLSSSKRRKQVQLSMHQHSHSHHHHHMPSSTGSKPLVDIIRRRRRLLAMAFFCALAILGPPLVRFRRLSETDIAAFSVTGVFLFLIEPLRAKVKEILVRIRKLGEGISKHSPLQTDTRAVTRYLFQNESAADRVTLLGGVINLVLSVGKFFVGVTCNSAALIADAGHSLSDLFSDFVTLWAVQVGRLPPDDDHPYGHGKFEAIGSLFLSLTLFATGIGVGALSNKKLLEIIAMQRNGSFALGSVAIPGVAALAMALLSVVSKEWLFRITRTVADRLNSQIVLANAWHHRSDAYSSVLALVSIALARYVPSLIFADAAAGMFVAAMICMTGAEILGESIKQLTDTSNMELVRKVTALAYNSEDVESVLRVRSRQVGSASTVDVEVTMLEDLAPTDSLAVEQRLKEKILQQDGVVDCEVRATSASVICEMLENRKENPVSTSEMEACVREEIVSRHPEVDSIEGVTIHFQDSLLVDVDVDIRLDPFASIARAAHVADGIRGTLERSNQINKANIFLDLNGGVMSGGAKSQVPL